MVSSKTNFREIKLLLLGSGESGKSTIVKQMKIIHGNGYSEAERILFRPVVFCNAVQSLYTIIKEGLVSPRLHLHHLFFQAMAKLRMDFEKESCYQISEIFVHQSSNVEDTEFFPPELAAIMMELWRDAGIQETFNKSNEYQLNDSAGYFLGEMERISETGYIPTDQVLQDSSM